MRCSKTTKDGEVQCQGSSGHDGPCFFGGVTLNDFERASAARERGETLDAEVVRWQGRIEETIRSVGLEPHDASGNESGDPLDYTADQIAMALNELRNRANEAEEALRGLVGAWSAAPIYVTGEGQMRFLDAVHECECVLDSLPPVSPKRQEKP